jgi:hypothetical protein
MRWAILDMLGFLTRIFHQPMKSPPGAPDDQKRLIFFGSEVQRAVFRVDCRFSDTAPPYPVVYSVPGTALTER